MVGTNLLQDGVDPSHILHFPALLGITGTPDPLEGLA